MFLRRWLFSLLFFTSALRVEPAAEPIAKAAWEPVCNLEIQLRRTANKAARISATIASALSAVAKTRAKVQIAQATTADTNKTIALEALSIALSQKEQALQGDAAATNDLAIRATAVTSTLRGRITEAISILLLGDTASSGPGYCLATAGGAATAKAAIAQLGCDSSITQLEPADASPDQDHMTADGFAKVKTATSVYADTNDDASKCTLLNIGSTANTHSFSTGTLAAGLISITASTTGTLGNYNTGISTTDRDSSDLVKAAFFDATAIKNIQLAQYITDEMQIASSAASKPTLKPILAKLLQRGQPTLEQQRRDRIADEIIDTVFGNDGKKMNNLWEELQRRQVKGNQVDPNKEGALSGVTTLSELQEVLSYYEDFSRKHAEELQIKIDQLESQNSKKDVKSLEQICNEKEDAETCRQDKNCKFNENKKEGSKCVLNEEGKQAEKANQETGGKDEKTDCSKLTTQTECEKANEGQTTKVCGWKGENTDGSDKGTYKCRDSSFLLSKHFALSVVSAAFVALLF
uniref:Variant surface glycoprotein n=1 Tax=Trypanosoma brucei TaxID=5691 RepID=A0A1V0G0A5_9TRYP|nr:variant surface glycoprotein [Trypanosoma brucei]